MTKNDLSKKIIERLLDEELLNKTDYPDIESLTEDVKNILLDCLDNFIIISGQIVE